MGKKLKKEIFFKLVKPHCNFFLFWVATARRTRALLKPLRRKTNILIERKFLYFYQENELHQDKRKSCKEKRIFRKTTFLLELA